jgi:hypothetical protein
MDLKARSIWLSFTWLGKGDASSSVIPLEMANIESCRDNSGRPHLGQAGLVSVFTRREKNLNVM